MPDARLSSLLSGAQPVPTIAGYHAKLEEKRGEEKGFDGQVIDADEWPDAADTLDKLMEEPESQESVKQELESNAGTSKRVAATAKSAEPSSSSKKSRGGPGGKAVATSPVTPQLERASSEMLESASMGMPDEDAASLAALSSKADQYLTDEELLKKYQFKIPLLAVLQGRSYGVQIKFAAEAVRKMKPMFAAQLKAYIKQVEMAKSLGPKEIDSLTVAELEAAVKSLQDVVTTFPPTVLQNIFSRNIGEVVKKVTSEAAEQTVQELLQLMRPFAPKAESGSKVDILRPKLWQIVGLGVPGTLQLLRDVWIGDVLCHLLAQGESSEKKCKGILVAIKSSFMRDLGEEEVPDCYVDFLSDLVKFAQGYLALVEGDALSHMMNIEHIEKLRKGTKAMSSNALAMLCSSFAEVGYYAERLHTAIEDALRIRVHRLKLDSVKEALAKQSFESHGARMQCLLQLCKNLSYLQEEVSAAILRDMVTKAMEAVKSFWSESAIEKVELDESAVGCWQDLLMEATIAFPLEPAFADMKQSLASVLQARAGQTKLSNLLAKWAAVVQGINKKELDTLQQEVGQASSCGARGERHAVG